MPYIRSSTVFKMTLGAAILTTGSAFADGAASPDPVNGAVIDATPTPGHCPTEQLCALQQSYEEATDDLAYPTAVNSQITD